MSGRRDSSPQKTLMDQLRARHPGFREAVIADASVTAGFRGERSEFRGTGDAVVQAIRLAWVSDAFLAQVFYRAKAALQRRGVPLIPVICHKLAMVTAQVSIGNPVVMEPGVYIIHGQVVLDGMTTVGHGSAIAPWVTLGLRAGHMVGPTVGRSVSIGTGAKVIGEVTIGDGAVVGANSVVVRDVPPGATVAGAPASPTNSG